MCGEKKIKHTQLPTLLLSGTWSFVSKLIQPEGGFYSPESLIQMMSAFGKSAFTMTGGHFCLKSTLRVSY